MDLLSEHVFGFVKFLDSTINIILIPSAGGRNSPGFHIHTQGFFMCKHTQEIQTHSGAPLGFLFNNRRSAVRLRLTCDRVQKESPQSVTLFLYLQVIFSLPLLCLHQPLLLGQELHACIKSKNLHFVCFFSS